MVEYIQKREIMLKKLAANPNKAITIKSVLHILNAENHDLQYLAQKACISYLKSIYLMADKELFKFSEINVEDLS